jgi:hypothetical protein
MLRGDYAGNGTPHTQDGTPIDVYDGINVQLDDGSQPSFEAEWGPTGARCISSWRYSSLALTQSEVDAYHQHLSPYCATNTFDMNIASNWYGLILYTPGTAGSYGATALPIGLMADKATPR